MTAQSYKASSIQVAAVRASNTFFTLVFGAKSLVRLLSQTPRKYFSSSGAVDYACVIMSYFFLSIEEGSQCLFSLPINPTLLRLVRLIKVMRSLRLLNFLKGINKIVESLLLSLSFIGHLMLFCAGGAPLHLRRLLHRACRCHVHL